MPQVVVLVTAVAVVLGWRLMKREMSRVEARVAAANEAQRRRAAAVRVGVPLERDPATGIYRPRQDA